MDALPPELEAERAALLREIDEAFGGIRREDGVSWREAEVLDDWGGMEQRLAARAKDPERGWRGLVDDPNWEPDTGWGGFNFLDAKGFRYYLAPAMVRYVRCADGQELAWKLNLKGDKGGDEHRLSQWSLLDGRQRVCVRRFVEFMLAVCASDESNHRDWNKALGSYWGSVEDTPAPKARAKPKRTPRSRTVRF